MFHRIPLLGSTGLVLLQLVACSADANRKQNSGASNERIDIDSGGTSTDLNRSGDDPVKSAACDYDPSRDLDPGKIKWRSALPRPRRFAPKTPGSNEYEVTVKDTKVQMLPDCYPQTQVFAYGGSTIGFGETEAKNDWSSPGPTFEMTRGSEAHVTWINDIQIPHLFPIDPTLHWANPKGLPAPEGPFNETPAIDPKYQSPVPIVTHVHGLEVASDSDGNPEAWFTPTSKPSGVTYHYPNSQPATALWYHDHALGITRLNVYAGLAGMYIIRDPNDQLEHPAAGASALPTGKYEMPLVIQQRSFKRDGSLDYPYSASGTHPYWVGGSGGDMMVVNGKVWPKMDVERTRYRFRVLNGSNTDTFTLSLPGMPLRDKFPFTVIGSDGGYLAAPVGTASLKLAPGQRADVIIDFSQLVPGQAVVLQTENNEVVQFNASAQDAKPPTCTLQPQPSSAETTLQACFPDGLNAIPVLSNDDQKKRTVTLINAPDSGYLLNGRSFHSEAIDEKPRVGTTEDWDIVNLSYEDHPIHLHLVQFKILDSQAIDLNRYTNDWNDRNNGGVVPLTKPADNPDVKDYLSSTAEPPAAEDSGWKDTVIASTGRVTRIRVRWTPQEGGDFPFDATKGPGYVWHCHMLEHEDNDMMRPLLLTK